MTSKKLIALLTGAFFILNEIALPIHALASTPQVSGVEVRTPNAFKLQLPADIGVVDRIHAGSGPTIYHIQEAHGHPEAQKNIASILNHLHQDQKIDLVLLEGNALPLNPELVNFFPENPKQTRHVLRKLANKALVTGPELFFLKNDSIKAYGIEDATAYARNGEVYVDVLNARNQSRDYLEEMEKQIERLASPYLNPKLRSFLKRMDDYDAGNIPLENWLVQLKDLAKEHNEIDLHNPWFQIEWPMLLRVFTLKAFETKLNMNNYRKERKKFFQDTPNLPEDLVRQIKTMLIDHIPQDRLPNPETGMLFEKMVKALPQNFRYQEYPNLNLFIGHLILRSELEADQLIDEMEKITDMIASSLAQSAEEEKLIQFFKMNRLLKRLFQLELTPKQYQKIKSSVAEARPSMLVDTLREMNQELRVRDFEWAGIDQINNLYDQALEFYRGAEERDELMLNNIEKRISENGSQHVVVITGGFHAGPFEKYFRQKQVNYALITPTLTDVMSHDRYVEMMLKRAETKIEIEPATHRPSDIFVGDFVTNPNWDYLQSDIIPEFGGIEIASDTSWFQSMQLAASETRIQLPKGYDDWLTQFETTLDVDNWDRESMKEQAQRWVNRLVDANEKSREHQRIDVDKILNESYKGIANLQLISNVLTELLFKKPVHPEKGYFLVPGGKNLEHQLANASKLEPAFVEVLHRFYDYHQIYTIKGGEIEDFINLVNFANAFASLEIGIEDFERTLQDSSDPKSAAVGLGKIALREFTSRLDFDIDNLGVEIDQALLDHIAYSRLGALINAVDSWPKEMMPYVRLLVRVALQNNIHVLTDPHSFDEFRPAEIKSSTLEKAFRVQAHNRHVIEEAQRLGLPGAALIRPELVLPRQTYENDVTVGFVGKEPLKDIFVPDCIGTCIPLNQSYSMVEYLLDVGTLNISVRQEDELVHYARVWFGVGHFGEPVLYIDYPHGHNVSTDYSNPIRSFVKEFAKRIGLSKDQVLPTPRNEVVGKIGNALTPSYRQRGTGADVPISKPNIDTQSTPFVESEVIGTNLPSGEQVYAFFANAMKSDLELVWDQSKVVLSELGADEANYDRLRVSRNVSHFLGFWLNDTYIGVQDDPDKYSMLPARLPSDDGTLNFTVNLNGQEAGTGSMMVTVSDENQLIIQIKSLTTEKTQDQADIENSFMTRLKAVIPDGTILIGLDSSKSETRVISLIESQYHRLELVLKDILPELFQHLKGYGQFASTPDYVVDEVLETVNASVKTVPKELRNLPVLDLGGGNLRMAYRLALLKSIDEVISVEKNPFFAALGRIIRNGIDQNSVDELVKAYREIDFGKEVIGEVRSSPLTDDQLVRVIREVLREVPMLTMYLGQAGILDKVRPLSGNGLNHPEVDFQKLKAVYLNFPHGEEQYQAAQGFQGTLVEKHIPRFQTGALLYLLPHDILFNIRMPDRLQNGAGMDITHSYDHLLVFEKKAVSQSETRAYIRLDQIETLSLQSIIDHGYVIDTPWGQSIGVVAEHQDVVPIWREAHVDGVIEKGSSLFHIDAHEDDGLFAASLNQVRPLPDNIGELQSSEQAKQEYLAGVKADIDQGAYNRETFIAPEVINGLIDPENWFFTFDLFELPSLYTPFQTLIHWRPPRRGFFKTTEGPIFRAGPVTIKRTNLLEKFKDKQIDILDFDIDAFDALLESKTVDEIIQEWGSHLYPFFAKAKVITFASSPGFINQEKGVALINGLLQGYAAYREQTAEEDLGKLIVDHVAPSNVMDVDHYKTKELVEQVKSVTSDVLPSMTFEQLKLIADELLSIDQFKTLLDQDQGDPHTNSQVADFVEATHPRALPYAQLDSVISSGFLGKDLALVTLIAMYESRESLPELEQWLLSYYLGGLLDTSVISLGQFGPPTDYGALYKSGLQKLQSLSETRSNFDQIVQHSYWDKLMNVWNSDRTREGSTNTLFNEPQIYERIADLYGYSSFLELLNHHETVDYDPEPLGRNIAKAYVELKPNFRTRVSHFYRYPVQYAWVYDHIRKSLREKRGTGEPVIYDYIGPGFFQEVITVMSIIQTAYEDEGVSLDEIDLQFNVYDLDSEVSTWFQNGSLVFNPEWIRQHRVAFDVDLGTYQDNLPTSAAVAITQHNFSARVHEHLDGMFAPLQDTETGYVRVNPKHPWLQKVYIYGHAFDIRAHSGQQADAIMMNEVFRHVDDPSRTEIALAISKRLKPLGVVFAAGITKRSYLRYFKALNLQLSSVLGKAMFLNEFSGEVGELFDLEKLKEQKPILVEIDRIYAVIDTMKRDIIFSNRNERLAVAELLRHLEGAFVAYYQDDQRAAKIALDAAVQVAVPWSDLAILNPRILQVSEQIASSETRKPSNQNIVMALVKAMQKREFKEFEFKDVTQAVQVLKILHEASPQWEYMRINAYPINRDAEPPLVYYPLHLEDEDVVDDIMYEWDWYTFQQVHDNFNTITPLSEALGIEWDDEIDLVTDHGLNYLNVPYGGDNGDETAKDLLRDDGFKSQSNYKAGADKSSYALRLEPPVGASKKGALSLVEYFDTKVEPARSETRLDAKFNTWADRIEELIQQENHPGETWQQAGRELLQDISDHFRESGAWPELKDAGEIRGVRGEDGMPDTKRRADRILTPEILVKTLGLYLLQKSLDQPENPWQTDDFTRLQSLIDVYNANELGTMDLSIPSVFVRSLNHYISDHEKFVTLSKQILELPEPYRNTAIALLAYAKGSHLMHLSGDVEDDILISADLLEAIIKELKRTDLEATERRMLVGGLQKLTMFIVPLTYFDPEESGQVSMFGRFELIMETEDQARTVIGRLRKMIHENAGEIRKWLKDEVPWDLPTDLPSFEVQLPGDDPYLSGLTWILYDWFETEIVQKFGGKRFKGNLETLFLDHQNSDRNEFLNRLFETYFTTFKFFANQMNGEPEHDGQLLGSQQLNASFYFPENGKSRAQSVHTLLFIIENEGYENGYDLDALDDMEGIQFVPHHLRSETRLNPEVISTEILQSAKPSRQSPEAVAREFRSLLDSGVEMKTAGSLKNNPYALLLMGHTPKHKIQLFDTTYYVTNVRRDEEEWIMVGYVLQTNPRTNKQEIRANLFYKDYSLIWRSASHYIGSEGGVDWFGKGETQLMTLDEGEYYVSMEESTNLPYEIQSALDKIAMQAKRPREDKTMASLVLGGGRTERVDPYREFIAPRRSARANRKNLINRGRKIAYLTRKNDPTSAKFTKGYEPDFQHGIIDVWTDKGPRTDWYGGDVVKYRVASKNRETQYLISNSPLNEWGNPPQAFTTDLSSFGVRTIDVHADDDIFIPGFEYHYVDDEQPGSPLYTQIPEGFAGKSNEHFEYLLNTRAWTRKLPFIQSFKRNVLRRGIKKANYRAKSETRSILTGDIVNAQGALLWTEHMTQAHFEAMEPALDEVFARRGKEEKYRVIIEVGPRGVPVPAEFNDFLGASGFLSNSVLTNHVGGIIYETNQRLHLHEQAVLSGEISAKEHLRYYHEEALKEPNTGSHPYLIPFYEYIEKKMEEGYDIVLAFERLELVSTLLAFRHFRFIKKRLRNAIASGDLDQFLKMTDHGARLLGTSDAIREKALINELLPQTSLQDNRFFILPYGTYHLNLRDRLDDTDVSVVDNRRDDPRAHLDPVNALGLLWGTDQAPIETERHQQIMPAFLHKIFINILPKEQSVYKKAKLLNQIAQQMPVDEIPHLFAVYKAWSDSWPPEAVVPLTLEWLEEHEVAPESVQQLKEYSGWALESLDPQMLTMVKKYRTDGHLREKKSETRAGAYQAAEGVLDEVLLYAKRYFDYEKKFQDEGPTPNQIAAAKSALQALGALDLDQLKLVMDDDQAEETYKKAIHGIAYLASKEIEDYKLNLITATHRLLDWRKEHDEELKGKKVRIRVETESGTQEYPVWFVNFSELGLDFPMAYTHGLFSSTSTEAEFQETLKELSDILSAQDPIVKESLVAARAEKLDHQWAKKLIDEGVSEEEINALSNIREIMKDVGYELQVLTFGGLTVPEQGAQQFLMNQSLLAFKSVNLSSEFLFMENAAPKSITLIVDGEDVLTRVAQSETRASEPANEEEELSRIEAVLGEFFQQGKTYGIGPLILKGTLRVTGNQMVFSAPDNADCYECGLAATEIATRLLEAGVQGATIDFQLPRLRSHAPPDGDPTEFVKIPHSLSHVVLATDHGFVIDPTNFSHIFSEPGDLPVTRNHPLFPLITDSFLGIGGHAIDFIHHPQLEQELALPIYYSEYPDLPIAGGIPIRTIPINQNQLLLSQISYGFHLDEHGVVYLGVNYTAENMIYRPTADLKENIYESPQNFLISFYLPLEQFYQVQHLIQASLELDDNVMMYDMMRNIDGFGASGNWDNQNLGDALDQQDEIEAMVLEDIKVVYAFLSKLPKLELAQSETRVVEVPNVPENDTIVEGGRDAAQEFLNRMFEIAGDGGEVEIFEAREEGDILQPADGIIIEPDQIESLVGQNEFLMITWQGEILVAREALFEGPMALTQDDLDEYPTSSVNSFFEKDKDSAESESDDNEADADSEDQPEGIDFEDPRVSAVLEPIFETLSEQPGLQLYEVLPDSAVAIEATNQSLSLQGVTPEDLDQAIAQFVRAVLDANARVAYSIAEFLQELAELDSARLARMAELDPPFDLETDILPIGDLELIEKAGEVSVISHDLDDIRSALRSRFLEMVESQHEVHTSVEQLRVMLEEEFSEVDIDQVRNAVEGFEQSDHDEEQDGWSDEFDEDEDEVEDGPIKFTVEVHEDGGVVISRRSETRMTDEGGLLRELGLNKRDVKNELSNGYGWRLRDYYADLVERNGHDIPSWEDFGGHVGFAVALGLRTEYGDAVLKIHQERGLHVQQTEIDLGLPKRHLKTHVFPEYGVTDNLLIMPSGVLLPQMAKRGEKTNRQIKSRLLQELKVEKKNQRSWNLPKLREQFVQKYPYLSSSHFTYADMLWGLGLADDFLTVYFDRYREAYGVIKNIGQSFGFESGKNMHGIDSMARDLSQRLNRPFVLPELDALEILGFESPEALAERMAEPDIKWSIYAFIDLYKEEYSWVESRKGHVWLLDQLQIKDAYVRELKRRYVAYGGMMGPLARSFGYDETAFYTFLGYFEFDLRDLEIPEGNFLEEIYPDQDPEEAADALVAELDEAEWKNFAGLKKRLLGGHKFITEQKLSQGWFIWGVWLKEPFLARLGTLRERFGNDLGAIARELGFTITPKRSLEEILEELAPEDLESFQAEDEEPADIQRGELLKRGNFTKAELRTLMDDEEVNWSLHLFLRKHGNRMRFYGAGLSRTYAQLLVGLNFENEYKKKMIEIYKREHGVPKRTYKTLGMTRATFLDLSISLEIDWTQVKVPAGTLLPVYAHEGESVDDTKKRILGFLGKKWDVLKLRKKLGKNKKMDALKDDSFSYARMIWALGITEDFIAVYRERIKGDMPEGVGLSFGFSSFEAAATLNRTIRHLEKLRGRPINVKRFDLVDAFRNQGVKNIGDLMASRAINWRIPVLIQKYKNKIPWLKRKRYIDVIKALGLEDEYRQVMIDRFIENHGSPSATARHLGMKQVPFETLAKHLGVRLTIQTLPAGYLLKKVNGRKKDENNKKDILALLAKWNWNLEHLKRILARRNPAFGATSMSIAAMVVGLDIEREFYEKLEDVKRVHHADMEAQGAIFFRKASHANGSFYYRLETLLDRLAPRNHGAKIQNFKSAFHLWGTTIPRKAFPAHRLFALRIAAEKKDRLLAEANIRLLLSGQGEPEKYLDANVLSDFWTAWELGQSDKTVRSDLVESLLELEEKFNGVPSVSSANEWVEKFADIAQPLTISLRAIVNMPERERTSKYGDIMSRAQYDFHRFSQLLDEQGRRRAREEVQKPLEHLGRLALHGKSDEFIDEFSRTRVSVRGALEELSYHVDSETHDVSAASETRQLTANLDLTDAEIQSVQQQLVERLELTKGLFNRRKEEMGILYKEKIRVKYEDERVDRTVETEFNVGDDSIKYQRIGPLFFFEYIHVGDVQKTKEAIGTELLEKYGGNFIFYPSNISWPGHDYRARHMRRFPDPFLSVYTSVMIVQMMQSSLTDKTVLDIGAGHGILSILALRLGAKRVYSLEGKNHLVDEMRDALAINGHPVAGVVSKVRIIEQEITPNNYRDMGLPRNALDEIDMVVAHVGSPKLYGDFDQWIIEFVKQRERIGQAILGGYGGLSRSPGNTWLPMLSGKPQIFELANTTSYYHSVIVDRDAYGDDQGMEVYAFDFHRLKDSAKAASETRNILQGNYDEATSALVLASHRRTQEFDKIRPALDEIFSKKGKGVRYRFLYEVGSSTVMITDPHLRMMLALPNYDTHEGLRTAIDQKVQQVNENHVQWEDAFQSGTRTPLEYLKHKLQAHTSVQSPSGEFEEAYTRYLVDKIEDGYDITIAFERLDTTSVIYRHRHKKETWPDTWESLKNGNLELYQEQIFEWARLVGLSDGIRDRSILPQQSPTATVDGKTIFTVHVRGFGHRNMVRMFEDAGISIVDNRERYGSAQLGPMSDIESKWKYGEELDDINTLDYVAKSVLYHAFVQLKPSNMSLEEWREIIFPVSERMPEQDIPFLFAILKAWKDWPKEAVPVIVLEWVKDHEIEPEAVAVIEQIGQPKIATFREDIVPAVGRYRASGHMQRSETRALPDAAPRAFLQPQDKNTRTGLTDDYHEVMRIANEKDLVSDQEQHIQATTDVTLEAMHHSARSGRALLVGLGNGVSQQRTLNPLADYFSRVDVAELDYKTSEDAIVRFVESSKRSKYEVKAVDLSGILNDFTRKLEAKLSTEPPIYSSALIFVRQLLREVQPEPLIELPADRYDFVVSSLVLTQLIRDLPTYIAIELSEVYPYDWSDIEKEIMAMDELHDLSRRLQLKHLEDLKKLVRPGGTVVLTYTNDVAKTQADYSARTILTHEDLNDTIGSLYLQRRETRSWELKKRQSSNDPTGDWTVVAQTLTPKSETRSFWPFFKSVYKQQEALLHNSSHHVVVPINDTGTYRKFGVETHLETMKQALTQHGVPKTDLRWMGLRDIRFNTHLIHDRNQDVVLHLIFDIQGEGKLVGMYQVVDATSEAFVGIRLNSRIKEFDSVQENLVMHPEFVDNTFIADLRNVFGFKYVTDGVDDKRRGYRVTLPADDHSGFKALHELATAQDLNIYGPVTSGSNLAYTFYVDLRSDSPATPNGFFRWVGNHGSLSGDYDTATNQVSTRVALANSEDERERVRQRLSDLTLEGIQAYFNIKAGTYHSYTGSETDGSYHPKRIQAVKDAVASGAVTMWRVAHVLESKQQGSSYLDFRTVLDEASALPSNLAKPRLLDWIPPNISFVRFSDYLGGLNVVDDSAVQQIITDKNLSQKIEGKPLRLVVHPVYVPAGYIHGESNMLEGYKAYLALLRDQFAEEEPKTFVTLISEDQPVPASDDKYGMEGDHMTVFMEFLRDNVHAINPNHHFIIIPTYGVRGDVSSHPIVFGRERDVEQNQGFEVLAKFIRKLHPEMTSLPIQGEMYEKSEGGLPKFQCLGTACTELGPRLPGIDLQWDQLRSMRYGGHVSGPTVKSETRLGDPEVTVLAERFTRYLALELYRQESQQKFENLVSRLAIKYGFAVESPAIDRLPESVRNYFDHGDTQSIREIFENSDKYAEKSLMLRVGHDSAQNFAVPILRTILDPSFEFVVIVDDAATAQDLKIEARAYAKLKLNMTLNESRFRVEVRDGDLSGTVTPLIVKGKNITISADGEVNDQLSEELTALPLQTKTLRLIDNSNLSIGEEMVMSNSMFKGITGTRLDERTYQLTQNVQYTSDHVDGPYAELLEKARALAAVLKAA